ncbi:MAG: Chemotaxis protein methyltransferase CheR [Myxococcaceae bacterium]|nr:Chemotaxis protein methyltransferase CheR [Myxococcaceae bacterium]
MSSTNGPVNAEEPLVSLEARVLAFTSEFEGIRNLPPHLGVRDPPESPNPSLLRDALERLHLEHDRLGSAREVLEAARSALEHERRRYLDVFEGTHVGYLRSDRAGVIREANRAAGLALAEDPARLVGRRLDAVLAVAAEQVGASTSAEVCVVGRAPMRVSLRGAALADGALWTVQPAGSGDRDALAAACQARDHVIATLAHELRTPMTVIQGWASLALREGVTAPDRERAMTVIERTARNLGGLLDRLLDVSRISAGKVRLTPARVDVADLARHAVEAVGPQAAELGVEVVCDVAAGLVVTGDAVRLSQALFNLLVNALRHSPPGATVTVRGRSSAGERGSEVRLSVVDQGCGIEPAHAEDIFECFRQLSPRQRGLAGLGLGLYLVRQIIELHGGTVRVESAGPGRGAEFVLTLPARAEA